ncbi:MAG: hypothetical protein A3I11_04020 [Elusimicrobia bacterium RIFCSPLOWO2_02_FULL_39_32]|nr:MAG: hypothetical protein A3B80_02595 [Elusimicrobia bacterium RIFCSPHIGHO2_02_FULL_39_36]OGR92870.1 MAG: hypothetical protein A3I11_04020 [Elusimicrobia bacterium RIFCSPLOWO2_02_FULL_39_32]OGR99654.1 MAG: hypothetical protein A3G85_01385 [Elusimicrobia bacterium RIFCSPLOWO2_12_FULL_39_28]
MNKLFLKKESIAFYNIKLISLFFIAFIFFISQPNPALSAPENDNFVNASTMTHTSTTTAGGLKYNFTHSTATLDASTETTTSEPTPSCDYGASGNFKSIWYKYLSTAAMSATADTFDSSFDTVLQSYKAGSPYNDITRLTQDTCNDDFVATNNRSQIQFNLAKGVTYYFQITSKGNSGAAGTTIFSSTFSPRSVDETVPTVTITQPSAGTFPTLSSLLVISGTSTDNAGVNSVELTISSGGTNGQGAGSSYWSGSTWGSTVSVNSFLKNYGSSSTLWDYTTLPQWVNGTTYYIRATAIDSSNNSSIVNLSSFTFFAPNVSNDDYSNGNVTVIDSLNFTSQSTTTAANFAIQKTPSCEYGAGNRDVWFRHVSTTTKGVEANTNDSDFNTILTVWKSTGGTDPVPGANATEIGCDHPYNTNATVKFSIENGATYYVQVMSDYGSGGILRFQFKELSGDNSAPDPVTNLTAAADIEYGAVKLTWTSPGDDARDGTAASYDIRFSTTEPVNNDLNFSTAVRITNSPTLVGTPPNDSLTVPQVAYTVQTQLIKNLTQNTTVWFAMKTMDDVFNLSALSNGATIFVPGSALNSSNDNSVNATTITAIPFSHEIITTEISNGAQKTPTCNTTKFTTLPTSNDVWYRLLSTATRNVTVNTFNSSFDTILQVWRGSEPIVVGQPIDCNDDASSSILQSKVFVPLSAGTTYFFQILGANNAKGTLRFQLSDPDSAKPSQINDLTATPGGASDPIGSVNLTWTEPADDGSDALSGSITKYHIRYSSTTGITTSNWSNALSSSGIVLDIEANPVKQVPPSPATVGATRSYQIKNLTAGVTYWFSVRAQDDAGNLGDPSKSPFTSAKPFTAQPGDGQGTVQIFDVSDLTQLTSVPISSLTTINFHFTVGASSITDGGKISFRIPDFWSQPQLTNQGNNGFVNASTITPTAQLKNISLSLDPNDNRVIIASVTTNGKFNSGHVLNFKYKGITAPSTNSGVQFAIKSQASNNGVLTSILVQPSINITAGNATNVGFPFASSNITIVLSSGQSSPPLFLESRDASYQPTTAHKDLQIRIFTLSRDTTTSIVQYDNSGQISEDNFATILASSTISTDSFKAIQNPNNYKSLANVKFATYYALIIPKDSSGKNIYYKTNAVGDAMLWLEWNDDFAAGVSTLSTNLSVKIRADSFGFNNFQVVPATITPDGDGIDDFASILFTPSNNETYWRVRIGTDPILSQLSQIPITISSITPMFEFWNFGQPQGLSWYGNDYAGSIVQSSTSSDINSTYVVRLEDASGGNISTRTIGVQSSYLDVFVTTGNSGCGSCVPLGLSGAIVSANGQSGKGFVYRSQKTGSDGKARVWGLKSGAAYSLTANYFDPTTYKNFDGNLANQTAGNPPTSASTITFSPPIQIRVHGTIPQTAVETNYDNWGFVNVVNNSNGFPSGFGSLRFSAGSQESDSGYSFTGVSTWTAITVPPNGTYKVRAELRGFSSTETIVTAGGSGTTDINFTFTKKPRVFGYVVLPSTQQFGTWVSVEGTKSGDKFPTSWGGAFIQGVDSFREASTTGAFVLDLDTGTYTIRARAFGVGTVSSASVPVGANGLGSLISGDLFRGDAVIQNGLTLAFSTTVAQGISGTISVEGDTSKIQGMVNSSFTLYINAFSPINYSYNSTQFQLLGKAGDSSITSGNYSIKGVEDGIYNVHTYLQGFESDPPGPKTVTVTNGVGSRDLKLKRYGGKIASVITIPNQDYENVSLTIEGPGVSSTSASISQSTVTSPNIGTGFYRVEVNYKTTNQFKSQMVNVINGQTSTVTFNLAATTFTVKGTVKVQPFKFGQTSSNSGGVEINTVNDLVNKLGYENINIGTGSGSFPIARIEAYPKDGTNFEEGLRNFAEIDSGLGGGGSFGQDRGKKSGFGQVLSAAITSSGTWAINLPAGVYILRHPVNLDPSAQYYNNTSFNQGYEPNIGDVANEEKVILLSENGTVQVISPANGNLEFTYSAGSSISGKIDVPQGASADTVFLFLKVLNDRNEIVNWQPVYLNGTTANYTLTNLSNGIYTLILEEMMSYNFLTGKIERKFVSKPLRVTISGSNVTNQNFQLFKPAAIEGKIAVVRVSTDGTKTTELITSNNNSLLPSNFRISAFAPGAGSGSSADGAGGAGQGGFGGGSSFINIDSTKGTFKISNLIPDTEYTVSFKQDQFSMATSAESLLGQGKLNLVAEEKSGISVPPGQTFDIGTVELLVGISMIGSVVDSSSQPIANVRIVARPAGVGTKDSRDAEVRAFTDERGSYTLSGLSYDLRYYNVTFAERDRSDAFLFNPGNFETRYAELVKRSVDVRKSSVPLNITLDLGPASIIGKVVTSDGKALQNPFGEGGKGVGFPIAVIVANKQGNIPTKNPIGDIEIPTNLDGTFTMDRLAAGTYDIYAFSSGYGVKKISQAVTNSQVNVGNITLAAGLSLSGKILKPDGSKPNTNELDVLAAANDDFSELTIASMQSNDQTSTVDGYTLAGLKSGTTYNLIIFTPEDETFIPSERYPTGGDGVSVTTDVANFNLTYTQTKPEVFLKGTKTGTKVGGIDQYKFEFECTQALRNSTLQEKADDYWKSVVSIFSSVGENGTISQDPEDSNPISPNRKKLNILYLPAADTKRVTFEFTSPTSGLQPGTTSNFTVDSFFEFPLGLEGQEFARYNHMRGVRAEIRGDLSQVVIPGGALKKLNGTDLEVSSNVSVGMQKANDVNTATTSVKSGAPSLRGSPSLANGTPSEESNLPDHLFKAIQAMKQIQAEMAAKKSQSSNSNNLKGAPMGSASNASEVANNVLGSFYDFFLPSGIRRNLAKNATLKLSYSSGVTSADSINVYFYNDTSSTVTTTSGESVPPGSYGLESSNKSVDLTNKTITVDVNHFTVYVVVNATSTVLGASSVVALSSSTSATPDTTAFNGSEIEIFNFPNPFNPTVRGFNFTGTKTNGQQTLRVTGATAFRYALPKNLGDNSVEVTLYVYDVSGDLVRTLNFGKQATGKYHYDDWDGKNEDGQTVASGVYIGRLKIEGSTRTKFLKMAVIK